MILAVGYRVRSPRGTQFRQWATARLSEYLVKGFTMDDERLRNPPSAGLPDYFDCLSLVSVTWADFSGGRDGLACNESLKDVLLNGSECVEDG